MGSEGKSHPKIKGDLIYLKTDFAGLVMCVIWLYIELGKQRTKSRVVQACKLEKRTHIFERNVKIVR